MNSFNSYSNPEYMSIEELSFLIEEYKRKNTSLLGKSVEKYNSLRFQKPPQKPPPSPPRTPPPILNRKSFKSVPLYQNLPNSISQIFSCTSSTTMIVKESISPPKPLMTSSRLRLNAEHKQPSKNALKNFRDIQEEFSIDEEDSTKIYESTRIKSRSPNDSYSMTQEDLTFFHSNPNYYYLQYSMNYDQEIKSPDSVLINKLETLNNISPPSPFKEGTSKKLNTYLAQLSPSENCLLTSLDIDCSRETLPDDLCCCTDICLSCSNRETCSSTSTSGYKSNQSNLSIYSPNSSNLAELNHFIEMNLQRLDRLKSKRKQLIKNNSCCP